jgi:hypothetical protein
VSCFGTIHTDSVSIVGVLDALLTEHINSTIDWREVDMRRCLDTHVML